MIIYVTMPRGKEYRIKIGQKVFMAGKVIGKIVSGEVKPYDGGNDYYIGIDLLDEIKLDSEECEGQGELF